MRDDASTQFDEDTRLMIEARAGDRQAYARLYEKYVPIVRTYLTRRNGLRQTEEDLVQEVFTRVWRRRSAYRPLAPVKSYLLGVAANVLRESRVEARGRGRIDIRAIEAVSDEKQPAPPSQLQSAERLQAVRVTMNSLPTRQRQAVELVYLAGLAPDEAARRLGCSINAVRTHLCRARQKLRAARPQSKGPVRARAILTGTEKMKKSQKSAKSPARISH